MAIFYKTKLVECETYEEFEDIVGDDRYLVSYNKIPKSYNVSEYSRVFKGFEQDADYMNLAEDHCGFLFDVCFYRIVRFTSPIFNVKNKTVTFFENKEKREKGVRSNPTKMGKFFRKIAPYFNDKQIEFLVNYVVNHFTDSVYDHHVAKGSEIAKIYTSKAESGRNIDNYSCLNASCMRYNNWDTHPTEVYATDSWELHYLTNEDEEIGARALVCMEDDSYSYIYASCEHAGNTLEEKLKELGFKNCGEVRYPFKGAKLLKIEGNGGLVAPYIDYHCDVKDCGDHLEISHGHYDYSFDSTDGYVDNEKYYDCECCGCEVSEDDVICVGGDTYCENCTFYCEHFGRSVVGEPIFVYYSNYSYYIVCEDALEDMCAVYNEEDNEWQTAEWYEECTKEDEEESEDEIEPKKEIAPGVKCVVISGYGDSHWFPIGTVVKVITKFGEKLWDCKSAELGFNQNIETKDLVVVE